MDKPNLTRYILMAGLSLTVLVLSACGGSGGDCIDDLSPGDHSYECENGITYLTIIPDECPVEGCGLIVDVHGGAMNASQMRENTLLHEIAPEKGYVVVHPNEGSLYAEFGSDDDEYVKQFMDDLIVEMSLDTGRIHFTGFSYGGNMSWRMACTYDGFLTSIAPIAGVTSCFDNGGINPEIPVLYMNGTQDNLVTMSSAESMKDDYLIELAMSGAGVLLGGDSSYDHTSWTNANGTRFDFVRHDYSGQALFAGHCIPGGRDTTGPQSTTCDAGLVNGEPSFRWGEMALDFFMSVE